MFNKRIFASLFLIQLSLSASLVNAGEKNKKKPPEKPEEPKKPEESKPDPKIEEAKKLFEEGSIQYKTGEYQKALESFKQVYALTQEPAILFNIGQCQKFLGQPEESLKSFRIFIRDAPENPLVENAKARIVEIEAEIAKKNALGSIQVMTNPEGAKIFIDEKDMGPGPIDLKEVIAGEHTISVKKESYYPYELRFELQAGQAFAIRVPLREEAKLPPEKFDPLQPKYFYMTAGGTGVLGAAFGVASVFFISRANKEQDAANGSDFLAEVKTSEKLKVPSVVLLGTSLVAVTSGVFLRLAEKKKSTEPCQIK
jgi:tetratricopeptide (TPR) repeat protein